MDRALLHRLIRGSGYLRGAPPGGPHKEWLHFCVTGEALEVIANFSIMDGRARVALIVRTGGEWHGDVEPIPAELTRWERGAIDLDFGHNTLRFDQRGFTVSIALSDRPVTATLVFEPETMPLLRPNTPLEDGAIHWMVVPRLSASGVVHVGSKRYELDRAPAYHDHNWGRFCWGDDFAWQWGFALPSHPELALAFVRLIDRARTRDVGHGLFLWRGAAQERIFREGELSIGPSGYLAPAQATKLPRPMALLAPEAATDVPAQVAIGAEGRGDRLEVVFHAEEMLQLLIPNDRDLGVTAINEISGRWSIRGEIGGRAIEDSGRGFFESLVISGGARLEGGTQRASLPATASGFAEFLKSSLAILEAETPAIYAAMCRALEGCVVRARVSGEEIALGFSKTRALAGVSLEPTVELATDRQTILDLCDGVITLAAAVRSDRMFLAGRSRELIAFDQGLSIYLAGAVRAPSFPGLLDDYREDARRQR